MRRVRIHTAQPLSPSVSLSLEPGPALHVRRVLRLGVGDEVVLFNGDGHDYPARIESVSRHGVSLRVLAREGVEGAPVLPVSLAQGVSKGERMDWVMQKSVELGVGEIVPVLTERSVVRLDADRREKRIAHWRGVVRAACEQSGRAELPPVREITPLAAWLEGLPAPGGETRLMFHPDGELGLVDLPEPSSLIRLLVGPEGGLSGEECRRAIRAGFVGVRLGPRVLRTETAALAALAAVQVLWGDLGGRR